MTANPQMPPWAIQLAARYRENRLTEIDRLWREPELIFSKIDKVPDPWQLDCLRSQRNLILNCSRQVGKSWVTSAIAILKLLRQPPSLVLIISPSERQSAELMKDKFMPMYQPWREQCPMIKNNEGEKSFANGSRLVALPGKTDANIRSYASVALLVIDEASRVPDLIYEAVTPMLAVSNGQKIALSTPFGKRGWFYNQWLKGSDWKKVQIKATECPRLSAAFLANEKAEKGDRAYKQEYLCSFEEAVGSVFLEEDITAAFGADIDGFGPLELFSPLERELLGGLSRSEAIEI